MKIPDILGRTLHLCLSILILVIIICLLVVTDAILPLHLNWQRIIGHVLWLLAIIHVAILFAAIAGHGIVKAAQEVKTLGKIMDGNFQTDANAIQEDETIEP